MPVHRDLPPLLGDAIRRLGGLHGISGDGVLPEYLNRPGHHADFVPTLRLGHLDVQFVIGQLHDRCGQPGHRAGDVFRDHRCSADQHREHGQQPKPELQQPLAKRGIKVVDINARTDNPSPRREDLRIRDFFDRHRHAGLRPHIAEKALAGATTDVSRDGER